MLCLNPNSLLCNFAQKPDITMLQFLICKVGIKMPTRIIHYCPILQMSKLIAEIRIRVQTVSDKYMEVKLAGHGN